LVFGFWCLPEGSCFWFLVFGVSLRALVFGFWFLVSPWGKPAKQPCRTARQPASQTNARQPWGPEGQEPWHPVQLQTCVEEWWSADLNHSPIVGGASHYTTRPCNIIHIENVHCLWNGAWSGSARPVGVALRLGECWNTFGRAGMDLRMFGTVILRESHLLRRKSKKKWSTQT
jgi:hypothetical protein